MTKDELLDQLIELIENLGFDFDRLSQSGQETYVEIQAIISQLSD